MIGFAFIQFWYWVSQDWRQVRACGSTEHWETQAWRRPLQRTLRSMLLSASLSTGAACVELDVPVSA